jgi:hypothetical protein
MTSNLRNEFLLLKDNDDSTYKNFVEQRHCMLFRPGDRVRIAHGILMRMDTNWLSTPMDADMDPTIGAFGTIFTLEFHGSQDSKSYDEDDPSILSIQFEQDWDPRLMSRYGLREIMYNIEAGDVINYTVLGEEDGNKLYDKTRDRNLEFYKALKYSVIPYDYQVYALKFCDKDGSSEYYLSMKDAEFSRHSIIVYAEMYNELIKVNRRFRWLVTYLKMNES